MIEGRQPGYNVVPCNASKKNKLRLNLSNFVNILNSRWVEVISLPNIKSKLRFVRGGIDEQRRKWKSKKRKEQVR